MSEPTGPGLLPPGDRPEREASEAKRPTEVKRAITLYTATAAFLVFIGVSGLMMLDSTERALRKELDKVDDQQITDALSAGMLRPVLITTSVLILIGAIGHGLTAQGLSNRKTWARPLGFSFSGILLAVAALGAFTGAISIQTIFFLVAGLSGIMSLARPEVRDYLKPWPPRHGGPQIPWPPVHPGNTPVHPGNAPMTPGNPPPNPSNPPMHPGNASPTHQFGTGVLPTVKPPGESHPASPEASDSQPTSGDLPNGEPSGDRQNLPADAPYDGERDTPRPD